MGRKTEGQLTKVGDVDWYVVNPTQKGALELSFAESFNGGGGSHLYTIEVMNQQGTLLEKFDFSRHASVETYHVGVASTEAHYIKISHDSTLGPQDTGWYDLRVTQADTSKDYEFEINDEQSNANAITLGRKTEGQLTKVGDVDWYVVNPTQKGTLELSFTDNFNGGWGGSHLYTIEVMNQQGTVLERFDFSSGYTETYHVGVASTDAHYIKISHDSALGPQDTGKYNILIKERNTVYTSSSYTLNNTEVNLSLLGKSSINGIGNSLNNIISGNEANNILDGKTGADKLIGGAGNDTYIFAKGHGQDRVNNHHSNLSERDRVVLQSVNLGNVSFNQNGLDLVLSGYHQGDSILVENYFKGSQYQGIDFQFADQTVSDGNVAQYIGMANGMINAMAALSSSQAVSSEMANVATHDMTKVLLGTSAV